MPESNSITQNILNTYTLTYTVFKER